MIEYGIFAPDSADYTQAEAIETGFATPDDAQAVILDRYSPEDELHVHAVEEPDEDEEDEDEEDEDEQ